MKLDQWMCETDTTDEALALLVGVDRSTISRIRRGRSLPSVRIMLALRKATDGKVMPNDIHASIEATMKAAE